MRTWAYHFGDHHSAIMRSKEIRLDVITPLIVYFKLPEKEKRASSGMTCEKDVGIKGVGI